MAANTYAGTITVGTSNPIGTFTDTVRVGNVGSNDVTILSNTYTLSQVNTVQSTTDPPMYLGLIANSSGVVIQENLTTLNDLTDEVIQSLISDYGVNSYYLGVNPPSDGGTWVSRGALLDTLENFTITNSDYRLWHKTASASYTSYKAPLKLGPAYEIMQWTSAEVQNLIKKVEERIVATGVGTYALQSSSPGTGTWVSVGQISDVRRVVNSNPSYTGQLEYSGTFDVAVFTGLTPINYSGPLSYTGADSNYDGPGSVTYSGPLPYTAENNLNYTGPGFISYSGASNYTGSSSYVGEDAQVYDGPDYAGPVPSFLGGAVAFDASIFTGPSYTAFDGLIYGGTYQQGPTGPWYIGAGGAIYEQGDISTYTGTIPYTGGVADASVYTGSGGNYTGTNPDSTTDFYTSAAYSGPATETNYASTPVINYNGFSSGNYFGPTGFSGPAIFTNPDVLTYDGSTTTIYSGPNTFDNVDGSSYVGGATLAYTGQTLFTNPDGTSFTGQIPADYTGPTDYTGADQAFTGLSYLGPIDYTGRTTYSAGFAGPLYSGPGNYSANPTYTGPDTVSYTADSYFGPLPVDYVNSYFGPATWVGIANFNSFLAIYYGPTPEGAVVYSGPSGSPGPEIGYSTTIDSEQYIVTTDYSGETGFGATYSGVNPDGLVFTNFYTGPGTFTGSEIFINPDGIGFTGVYANEFDSPTNFTNPNASSFTATYTGPVPYQGPIGSSYEGNIYTNENSSFIGSPIVDSTTETITAVTLWKRVA